MQLRRGGMLFWDKEFWAVENNLECQVLLIPRPRCRDYSHVLPQLVYVVPGIESRVSCTLDKHSTNGATSLVLFFFFVVMAYKVVGFIMRFSYMCVCMKYLMIHMLCWGVCWALNLGPHTCEANFLPRIYSFISLWFVLIHCLSHCYSLCLTSGCPHSLPHSSASLLLWWGHLSERTAQRQTWWAPRWSVQQ